MVEDFSFCESKHLVLTSEADGRHVSRQVFAKKKSSECTLIDDKDLGCKHCGQNRRLNAQTKQELDTLKRLN